MTNLDLETKYVDFIKDTVFSVLPYVKIYIFGSRTQGTAQKYSDIDIALEQKDAIEIDKILLLKSKFRDSVFPYKIDIIDLNSVDEKFFNIIKNDLVEIN